MVRDAFAETRRLLKLAIEFVDDLEEQLIDDDDNLKSELEQVKEGKPPDAADS